MGLKDAITDAYGNVYGNLFVEESERLKKLQRKMFRQEKGSNNRFKTRKLIQKEHHRLKRRRDAAAIKVVKDLLDSNKTIVMQDEQLNQWKQKRKFKSKKTGKTVKRKFGGKKIQHGILGRVKQRLKNSEQVHVINKWVPTTMLCTHCGKIHKAITLEDRTFVCPHCGYDDGNRDQHSAKDMVWLYQNMEHLIGLDGAEFTRSDFDEGLEERFSSTEHPCSPGNGEILTGYGDHLEEDLRSRDA